MSIKPKTVVGVLIAVSLILIFMNRAEAPSLPTAHIENAQYTKQTQRPDALDKWIDKLAFCESSNRPEAINRFDGGSPSYGYLQWKEDSFWRYNNVFKVLPNLERGEVLNIIKCKETQVELARRTILTEHNGRGWRNWWNCARRAGLGELGRIREYYKKYGVVPVK